MIHKLIYIFLCMTKIELATSKFISVVISISEIEIFFKKHFCFQFCFQFVKYIQILFVHMFHHDHRKKTGFELVVYDEVTS